MNSEELLGNIQRLLYERRRFLKMAEYVYRLSVLDPNWVFKCRRVGMGNRRARYMVLIHGVAQAIEIDFHDYEHMGWTKLAKLCEAEVFGQDDATDKYWLDLAEPRKMTVKKLMFTLGKSKNTNLLGFEMTDSERVLVSSLLSSYGAIKSGRRMLFKTQALIAMCHELIKEGKK